MIVLINPNSTQSMTDAMLATAQDAAPMATFEGWTSHDGPPSIQGPEDGDVATEPLLALVRKASDRGASTIIIACFDDTALAEARRIARCPVIGIGQAAYHMAVLAGDRFSVVTTLAVAIPVLEDNIRAYGFGNQLARVRASNVPVLALEADPDAASDQIIEEIVAAVTEDAVQIIALGCGGMVDIAEKAAGKVDVKLIDGVRAAALIANGLS